MHHLFFYSATWPLLVVTGYRIPILHFVLPLLSMCPQSAALEIGQIWLPPKRHKM